MSAGQPGDGEARLLQGRQTGVSPGSQARRVLILSASMGDGHMQVSRELARRLTARGNVAMVTDLLALIPRPAGKALRSLYPWLVNRAPWLYEQIYRHFFLAPQRRAERGSIPVRMSLPGLRHQVEEFRPHVVVSTYHLAGVAAARLRAAGHISARTVTFVTTFGVHNLWLHPATDLYLCITPAAAAEVARRTGGVTQVCEPVVRSGLPAGAGAGEVHRSSLAVAPGERIALIAAGSLGLGAVLSAAVAVAGSPGWRPVVACGWNEELRKDVGRISHAIPLGWVEDMPSLIAAADVVIDNAAGSTAKEALAVGRPVVTFRPLPGHGRHDALMMQQAGLTDVTDDPRELVRLLNGITTDARRTARIGRGWSLFGTDPARLIEELAGQASGELAA